MEKNNTLGKSLAVDVIRLGSFVCIFLFHSRNSAFSYLYLGVDIFIFLSGYLLAKYLARPPSEFFRARVKSIAPPLIIFSLVSIVLSIVLSSPKTLLAVASSLLMTPFGLGHFFLDANTGYFGIEGVSLPTLHLWSLSIEILCYFALFLVIARKFFLFGSLILLMAVGDLSLSDPYYSALPRLFFCFLGIQTWFFLEKERFSSNALLATLVLTFVLFIGYGVSFMLPRMSVIGLVFLILFLVKSGRRKPVIVDHFLSRSFRISAERVYSLYLAHYLVFSMEASFLLNSHFNTTEIYLVGVASIITSEAIHRVSLLVNFATGVVLVSFVSVLSAVVLLTGGLPNRYENPSMLRFVFDGGVAEPNRTFLKSEGKGHCRQFLGDSHARQYYFLFENAGYTAVYKKKLLDQITKEDLKADDCETFIAFRWPGEKKEEIQKFLENFNSNLVPNVTILEDIPSFSFDPLKCLMRQQQKTSFSSCDIEVNPEIDRTFLVDNYESWGKLKERLYDRVSLGNIKSYFCSSDSCISSIDGAFLYRDTNHISEKLDSFVAKKILTGIGLLGE